MSCTTLYVADVGSCQLLVKLNVVMSFNTLAGFKSTFGETDSVSAPGHTRALALWFFGLVGRQQSENTEAMEGVRNRAPALPNHPANETAIKNAQIVAVYRIFRRTSELAAAFCAVVGKEQSPGCFGALLIGAEDLGRYSIAVKGL